MELAAEALIWLALAAVVAGFVDSIAGGGGLIAVPAMMLFGVPPINALATNKLQGSFGTATAAITMFRLGQIKLSDKPGYFLIALVGGCFGTWLVQQISADSLDIIIPLVLTIIALYYLLARTAGDRDMPAKLEEKPFKFLVVPLIGAYDGFFGPGAGSFYATSGVAMRGDNLVTATANAKWLNFASNVASLAVFVIGGKVLWLVGGVMIAGQVCGAWLGSLAVISKGPKLVRPVIVFACLVMVTRYAMQKGYIVL